MKLRKQEKLLEYFREKAPNQDIFSLNHEKAIIEAFCYLSKEGLVTFKSDGKCQFHLPTINSAKSQDKLIIYSEIPEVEEGFDTENLVWISKKYRPEQRTGRMEVQENRARYGASSTAANID